MTTKTLSSITSIVLLTTNAFSQVVLQDITVTTNNKTAQSLQNTTSNVTVISAEDIEEKGYTSVAEAIHSVAGISVANAGGLGQQTSFFVRGADSGKVLVLLDGMRLNDPSTTNGSALLDSLTTSNIAQIEILKGGSSSIWGSNASAGVINIITKKAKKGVHGSLGLSYGSYATRSAEFMLSYADEKLTAQVLASSLATDGFSVLAPNDAESDSHRNDNINLSLGYAFNENHKAKLSYNSIKTKTDFDDAYSTAFEEDRYSHSTSNQNNISLNYSYTNDNYSASFNASQGDYDRDYYTKGFYGEGHNKYKATLKEYSLINTYSYGTSKAILGLEYKNIDGFNQYNSFHKSQSIYTNKAIFLSNVYSFRNNTSLETNIRHDAFNQFDDKTTYKVGIKHAHTFIDGFTTSANYYSSYDAPSAYQLANSEMLGLLKPVYTKGYSVTTAYKDILLATYFNNTVEDSIDYISDPITYIGGYKNISGESKFSGVELEGKYDLSAYNVLLSANYTHLIDYKKEDGSLLNRRAKDTLNATVNYYISEKTLIGLQAQYIGDRLDTDGTFPVSSNVSTGNYTLWNLNYSTTLSNNITVNINAKNILDKAYQSIYKYATQGRSVYAKVKYSF
jgi:vitamin B12 transporter